MNAQQARTLAKQNAFKLADEYLKDAIQKLNTEIKQSASRGKNSAMIIVSINNIWIEENLAEKVVAHFLGEGFEVKTGMMVFTQTIYVSW